ncbi:hypothetical protein AYI68_g2205 [Smittium mucronatum]|uniref:Uncharacterized protein n=1 Tax=Smittium mucronatum TaxID=133383 RepID=A0A1R0H3C3_9FUNG|nr:hypothetical protein AYI68_g2205 [Smittium mucronatum]
MNPADAPSRLIAQTEWSISDQAFSKARTPFSSIGQTDQPLLLPPTEFDIPDGDVVSGPAGIISITAVSPTGNNGHTGPQKRKISTFDQQTLVSHGMENQLRVLQEQGLSLSVIQIIIFNQKAFKRRSRYHSTQQHFLDWH